MVFDIEGDEIVVLRVGHAGTSANEDAADVRMR